MNKTTPFTIIFVESALERLKFAPKSRKKSKKGQQKRNKHSEKKLLDASIHRHLMHDLPEKEKRGRPDIIHNSLLLALGSRLNQEGHLRVFVHTRNDEVISLNPGVRIPRNYNRFVGLIEQLFEVKTVPPDSDQPLMSISTLTLEQLIRELEPDVVVLFTENGLPTNDKKLQNIFSDESRVVALVGGFPHGTISPKVSNLSDMKLSIYNKTLTTLVVISTVIQAAEQSLNII